VSPAHVDDGLGLRGLHRIDSADDHVASTRAKTHHRTSQMLGQRASGDACTHTIGPSPTRSEIDLEVAATSAVAAAAIGDLTSLVSHEAQNPLQIGGLLPPEVVTDIAVAQDETMPVTRSASDNVRMASLVERKRAQGAAERRRLRAIKKNTTPKKVAMVRSWLDMSDQGISPQLGALVDPDDASAMQERVARYKGFAELPTFAESVARLYAAKRALLRKGRFSTSTGMDSSDTTRNNSRSRSTTLPASDMTREVGTLPLSGQDLQRGYAS
jgi:hypothetical protein